MIDIFVKLRLGSHPVAVLQYTFTHRATQHKQYTEQHNTNNTQKNTKIHGKVRAVPRLCELYAGSCLTNEETARKTLSQGRKTLVRVEKPQSG